MTPEGVPPPEALTTTDRPIRVLVVDDHVIVRTGLEQLLATTESVELVGFAADGRAAVAAVEQHQPDVVLMDLSMPVMDGVEATRQIARQWPAVKVVILTSFSEQQRVLAALDAGAEGYVLKHADPEQILAVIDAVHRGGAPIDPQVARVLLDAKRVGAADQGAHGGRRATRELPVLGGTGRRAGRAAGAGRHRTRARARAHHGRHRRPDALGADGRDPGGSPTPGGRRVPGWPAG